MKFVFCEGKDDVAVVRGLASHLKLDIQVEEYGGKNNLPLFLESLQKRPDFAQQKVGAIAILRDANGDSQASFASVRARLEQNGFPWLGARVWQCRIFEFPIFPRHPSQAAGQWRACS